jgi:adenine-specific DNA-methyltransferase
LTASAAAASPQPKFRTIIGNPPYLKQKTGNLYLQFMERCFHLLEEDGELIFIVPSDFLKKTSASKLLSEMMRKGAFTDFMFPHNEHLFDGASIDIVVFRYQRGPVNDRCVVNGQEMYCHLQNGIISLSDTKITGCGLDELFHVHVGFVSGCDEIFNTPFGNIEVLCDRDIIRPFILTSAFPTNDPCIDDHLLSNKERLMSRRIKKFSEKNWFEWGRIIHGIQDQWDQPCIYVRNMTRQKEVAFVDKVRYFSGALLCLIPKTPMTATRLQWVCDYINREEVMNNYMYAGRFKIGQKQLSNLVMPVE